MLGLLRKIQLTQALEGAMHYSHRKERAKQASAVSVSPLWWTSPTCAVAGGGLCCRDGPRSIFTETVDNNGGVGQVPYDTHTLAEQWNTHQARKGKDTPKQDSKVSTSCEGPLFPRVEMFQAYGAFTTTQRSTGRAWLPFPIPHTCPLESLFGSVFRIYAAPDCLITISTADTLV